MIRSRDLARWLKFDRQAELHWNNWNLRIFSCASKIFNVKYHVFNKFTQYLARFNRFYTCFFLIVDADDFLLAFKQTVPNSNMPYFRASVIYVSTNLMVKHRLMRIRHILVCFCLFDLILYVPSTIFQLNRDRYSWVEPLLS